MENKDEFNDLFSGNLDEKMDFLNDKKSSSQDGLYKIDLTKAKDKKRGYRSVIRFLPNLSRDGKVNQSAIEKLSHYVDIKNEKELSGWFDSPRNFNEKCPLTDLYFTMTNSKNAILQERSKCLKYSKKYFSYVLIMEDENQPELVGKVMIFSYGKTIRDKILAEKTGEISGIPCNVFDLSNGKDFVVFVKEITTGDDNYPDYKNSMFKPDITSISLYSEEKKSFKNVPLTDGKIDSKYQPKIKEFLLSRDHDIEDFSPKKLTEEQQIKISEISAYLTGKSSTSFASKAPSKSLASEDDFDTNVPSNLSDDDDDDDFFNDID